MYHCFQFLAIHIRSITAMLLRPESPEWLLHASATDVQLDGSLVRSARTLLVNVTMISASAKLLRHAPMGMKPRKPITSQFATCLAELSVSLSMELTLLAQGPFKIEVNHDSLILNELVPYAEMRNLISFGISEAMHSSREHERCH